MIERLKGPLAGIVASAVLLTGILGWMVVDRVRLLAAGREIVLPIRPVDPRDLFKGDYARLGYEISVLDSKLVPDDNGALSFVDGHSPAGASVDLRFEMNTLTAFSSAPHPLDPNPEYQPKPVKLIAYRAYAADASVPSDDLCRAKCPENGRGFTNTDRLFI